MKYCLTIEEFIINVNKYGMSNVNFDDSNKYKELMSYLMENLDKDNDGLYSYILARCYFDSKGVIEDKKQAIHWLIKGAEKGHARAQQNLGYCYFTGNGVEKDYNKACWFHILAEELSFLMKYLN